MGTFIAPPLESFEAYRAARTIARIACICAVVSGLVNIALVSFLISLFPLKEIQPVFVTLKSKAEQVVKIEPIERNQKAIDVLMETLAQQYVSLRETFDLQTEPERWKQVALMSSEKMAREFTAEMDIKSSNSPFKKRQQDGVTRSVEILSSTSLAPSSPNVFQVEWVSTDRHNGQVIGQGKWLVTMTVELKENLISTSDKFLNPIGFTVTHYTIAQKGGSDAPTQ